MRYGRMTRRVRCKHDDGQVMLSLVFGLSTVLVAVLAVGLDMTSLFFHHEAAQGAADAACLAAVMDMHANALQDTTLGGFTAGTNFDCATTQSAAPCQYAALNGYSSPGLTTGADSNDVSVTFPASVSGIAVPPKALAGTFPFIRVTVVDRVRTFFTFFVSGSKTQDVRASATCGVVMNPGPGPIIVLHPTMANSLSVGGTTTVKIVGGPPKGVQVNSRNATAASYNGGGVVDLSQGGPDFTGGYLGVVGGPTTAWPSSNFNGGTTGGWVAPTAPDSDPFATTAPPALPAAPSVPPDPYPSQCTTLANPCKVLYHVNGCPDTSGCDEYGPGLYTKALDVKNATAIFDPGIYYIQASGSAFVLDSNSTVRPSTATGDGSGGTLFYLSGGSASIGSNSGKNTGVDVFNTSVVPCPGGRAPNPPLPATMVGNVLLAPCTTNGAFNVPPTPQGPSRGLLFFQDRSNIGTNAQAVLNGGGGLLLVGTMYFHDCPNSLTTGCSTPPTDYQASVSLQGNSGTTTQVVGDIIADQLALGGNSTINMQLSPYSTLFFLRAALLQ
ncbi:MAG TPA: pilus assembly protein TadG-related protein [Terriglobia bacterium]|nr:pilus assembly protein TadG-related protein [Terriglobia bacterium]